MHGRLQRMSWHVLLSRTVILFDLFYKLMSILRRNSLPLEFNSDDSENGKALQIPKEESRCIILLLFTIQLVLII
jgi:hypothetical protein